MTDAKLRILRKMDVPDPPSLTPDELRQVPGFHYCPDWDFLPICHGSPEMDACLCGVALEGAT
jgi:hypothetical protein